MLNKTKENYSYSFTEEPSLSKHENILEAIEVLENNKIGYYTSEKQKEINYFRKIEKRYTILSKNIEGYLFAVILCLPGLFYFLFWENNLFVTRGFVLLITYLLFVGILITKKALKKINIYED